MHCYIILGKKKELVKPFPIPTALLSSKHHNETKQCTMQVTTTIENNDQRTEHQFQEKRLLWTWSLIPTFSGMVDESTQVMKITFIWHQQSQSNIGRMYRVTLEGCTTYFLGIIYFCLRSSSALQKKIKKNPHTQTRTKKTPKICISSSQAVTEWTQQIFRCVCYVPHLCTRIFDAPILNFI